MTNLNDQPAVKNSHNVRILFVCLLAPVAISCIGTVQQVAGANTAALNSRFRVSPFSESHLPDTRGQMERVHEPHLGRIIKLAFGTKHKSSAAMKTMFHIYTHDKVTKKVELQALDGAGADDDPLLAAFHYDLDVLAASGFDAARKRTVVIIPGFNTYAETDWAVAMAEHLLGLFGADVNVIYIGWSDSNGPMYDDAVANSVLVSRQITIFLHYLAQLGSTQLREQKFLDSLHLVGHSLGAHMAGYVGKDLGGRAGRITGLDPAGPAFDALPASQRLAHTDAQLVEVLHTNAGGFKFSSLSGVLTSTIPSMLDNKAHGRTSISFGSNLMLGHIDYFANDGNRQDGCKDSFHSCDHARGYDIYIDVLKRQLELRSSARTADAHGLASRLWAYRADDYEDFRSGANLERLCPQLVRAETHLDFAQVGKTFGTCAAPLLDFMSEPAELIRELRDVYHVDFDADSRSAEQPRYYFKTFTDASEPGKLVSDQYLVKVYLDRAETNWDSQVCSLRVQLGMRGGAQVSLETSKLEDDQTMFAAPFAHPAGSDAQLNLQKLSAASQEADKDAFESQLRNQFPNAIILDFGRKSSKAASAASDNPASSCQLAILQVEVAPARVYATNNIGALYEDASEASEPDQRLDFVNTRWLSALVDDKLTSIVADGDEDADDFEPDGNILGGHTGSRRKKGSAREVMAKIRAKAHELKFARRKRATPGMRWVLSGWTALSS